MGALPCHPCESGDLLTHVLWSKGPRLRGDDSTPQPGIKARSAAGQRPTALMGGRFAGLFALNERSMFWLPLRDVLTGWQRPPAVVRCPLVRG